MNDKDEFILAGDIGGTNARFGCLKQKMDGRWDVHHFAKMKVADYFSFADSIDAYLAGLDTIPNQAAFAAAGPVVDGNVNLTNADWQISAKSIAKLHAFERCEVYNDFAGMTRSVPELAEDDFTVIRLEQGHEDQPIRVAGAGTGFGVGYLIPTKSGWHIVASEGGHTAYSPQSDLEFELLQILRRSHDFVSLELVTSGKGLNVIHRAVCEIHGDCLLYTSPSPRDATLSRMPSSA